MDPIYTATLNVINFSCPSLREGRLFVNLRKTRVSLGEGIMVEQGAMKYALISDIHANRPALDAVLPDEFAEFLRTGGKTPSRVGA